MTQLEEDIKHIIECWLDYNRMQYGWKVRQVTVRGSELKIYLYSTDHNPYDPDEEEEKYTRYQGMKHYLLEHDQCGVKIKHISDISFPIIFYTILNQLKERDKWLAKH